MALLRDLQEDVLSRLSRVSVAARQAVEHPLAGSHRSLRRGMSVEFAGHRAYQPGDDPRHIDWQLWARTDRLDLRQYEEDARLRATLAVDCSGSMGYGSGAKLAFARALAGALGWLLVRSGDAVGLALFDTVLRRELPPRATMGHLVEVLSALENTAPGGETSLGGVLETLAGRLPRRGLVVLISDGLDEPERLLRALRLLRHRRQDVRLFLIADPDEESFPFRGACSFHGLEGEPQLRLDADRARAPYRTAFAEHRRQLTAGCHAAGTVLHPCRSDEDLALLLARALAPARPQR
ncbi:hypothetical protein LBMAG53_19750 [Planctomycetota bacterium]|nr:hypothetical protein LBMAG53_19750 [Planctomycetota bacterium]